MSTSSVAAAMAAPVVTAADPVPLTTVFLSEMVGTAILLLMGIGVVANALLAKSKGQGGGVLMIYWGWGLGVFAGVYVAYRSGAHINPAVTIGLLASGAAEYAPGVAVTAASTAVYLIATLLGACIGAVLAWLAYKDHFDAEEDQGLVLACFSTAPAIRNTVSNVLTEAIGTFVLMYVILRFGNTPTQVGPLAVALLVVGIGASLGGPTGYAINPARDLGPRIAHAILPIKGKGGSDWSYSWIPVVAPMIGAALAGLLARVI